MGREFLRWINFWWILSFQASNCASVPNESKKLFNDIMCDCAIRCDPYPPTVREDTAKNLKSQIYFIEAIEGSKSPVVIDLDPNKPLSTNEEISSTLNILYFPNTLGPPV